MQHSFEHCIKKNENVLEFKLRKVIILGDNRRLKKKKKDLAKLRELFIQ